MPLASVLGYVDDITETSVRGWVCDSNHLDLSLVVEIYEDEVKIGETSADIHRQDLHNAGIGSGNHGFNFNFPLSLNSHKIAVKVKNYDYELPKSGSLLEKEGDLNELVSFLKKFPRGTLPHLIHHYMPNGLPKVEYFLEATPQRNQDADLLICKRLIASFNSALEFESAHIKPESRPNSGLWEMLKHEFHGEIYNLLSKGNPLELSEYLCNGYQEQVCYGLGGGKWIEDAISSQKNKLAVSIIYFDRLVALSEALGILPYENPEQGRYGVNIYENLNAVAKKIEEKVGFSMGRPKVFGIHGLRFGDRVIDGRTPDHLWASWRIRQITGGNKNICEIGGGFGGNCHYSYKMGCKSYTIIDLPVINVVQAYFVMKCLGQEVVQLFGEKFNERPIKIMPYWSLAREDNLFDICFNQDSLPEMPLKVATEYLQRIPQVTQSYFYSIQQEACAPAGQNLTQLNISEIVANISDYKLIFRYPNWIRKGYVEELYNLAYLKIH